MMHVFTPSDFVPSANCSVESAGAVPPFGFLYTMPTYADSKLAASDRVFMNAGTHKELLGMQWADYEAMAHPQVCMHSLFVRAAVSRPSQLSTPGPMTIVQQSPSLLLKRALSFSECPCSTTRNTTAVLARLQIGDISNARPTA
jgi:hypothetical protein